MTDTEIAMLPLEVHEWLRSNDELLSVQSEEQFHSGDYDADLNKVERSLVDARLGLNEAKQMLIEAKAVRQDAVRAARDSGMSYSQIGELLGIGESHCRKIEKSKDVVRFPWQRGYMEPAQFHI